VAQLLKRIKQPMHQYALTKTSKGNTTINTLRTLIITILAAAAITCASAGVRNISRNGEVIILDDRSVYLIDTIDYFKKTGSFAQS
jgi:hypothetical protein